MSHRRRVVISGLGMVTPLGVGRSSVWDAVCRGRSAIGPARRFDASALRSQLAAEIAAFDLSTFVGPREARRLDRFSGFAVAAGLLALDDAGLSRGDPSLGSAAVCVGSALGGIAFGEEQHTRFSSFGMRAVSPTLALAVFGGAGAANLAIAVGSRGPTSGNANSCASGAVAIGEAFRLIERGDVDLALAGGAEAPLSPLTFGAFSVIRVMSARNDQPDLACRPFDAARDGFVMGEGATVLVLESLGRARARGRQAYAEIRGYGLTNDAWHMAAPRPDGSEAARAMSLAMADAGASPEDVDYISAHAAGTVAGDVAEARAIRRALGDHWNRVAVSGTKPLHGHALGATGAMEVGITAMAMRRGWLPPTKNLTAPGVDCELAHVPPGGLAAHPEVALCNAFGFGGVNTCLLLRRATDD